MLEKKDLPAHVGIIMDGNGRWARQRGFSRSQGHKQGAKVFKQICEYAGDLGISHLTFYAFSTENWKRPSEEVQAIMALFRDYLNEAQERKTENEEKGMQIRFIGQLNSDEIPEDISHLVKKLESDSSDKFKTVVNIAVNYGGRQEILKSVRELSQRIKNGELLPDHITEKDIENGLYTAGQPDPDLIIRPSGEYRISNFLLWQSAYSEFWYSDVLWPDFTAKDFDRAIENYCWRNRRFGGI
ncbi:MAG TPA: polyprenyl diphosphate synthase [Clostridia bacterium]|nr:polyprenyl diphosphate synthase [Clostridia bacterium]